MTILSAIMMMNIVARFEFKNIISIGQDEQKY